MDLQTPFFMEIWPSEKSGDTLCSPAPIGLNFLFMVHAFLLLFYGRSNDIPKNQVSPSGVDESIRNNDLGKFTFFVNHRLLMAESVIKISAKRTAKRFQSCAEFKILKIECFYFYWFFICLFGGFSKKKLTPFVLNCHTV